MSGGFTYMTDERMKECESAMLQSLSDAKKRREQLKLKLARWSLLFLKASAELKGESSHEVFSFESLPEKQELIDAWAEWKTIRKEFSDLQETFRAYGLDIQ
jgi:hypothetical protein